MTFILFESFEKQQLMLTYDSSWDVDVPPHDVLGEFGSIAEELTAEGTSGHLLSCVAPQV